MSAPAQAASAPHQDYEPLEFFMQGGSVQALTTPLSDELGLDWRLMVAVPASDFLAPVQRNILAKAALGL